ncbi:HAD family hydrolase [Haladaptatus sp. NG-WS-4]
MFERARRKSNVPDHDGLHERYVTTFLEYFSNCHPEPYRAAMADLCTEFSLSTDGDTFAEVLVESELSNVEVTDSVHDLLDDLSADHELGVLTNGAGHVQRAKLDICGLETYSDTVVASCEVGARRPESEIFARAKDKLSRRRVRVRRRRPQTGRPSRTGGGIPGGVVLRTDRLTG